MQAADPDDYQPPLRWWGQAWRYLLALAIGVVVWVQVIEEQAEHEPLLFWLDLFVGICAFVLVGWRRKWPMPVAIATGLLAPFTSIGAGAVLLATVSVATRRRVVEVGVIGALSLLTTLAYNVVQPVNEPDPAWFVALFSIVFIAASLAWGMFIGSRRELMWTLHRRAEAAEAERDLRAGQARSDERASIAREMHDVLAHRISQISMHAGALTFRDDLDANELRDGLELIQHRAYDALTDLREVLGVLRDDGSDAPATVPQPTYDDIAVLIAEAQAAGVVVELDDRLTQTPTEQVGRTIFRIVQEAITNATKHAPAASIRVELSGTQEAGIDITVRNALGFGPTRTPGAGMGLIGLSERAELRGGTLRYGIENGTPASFVLRAWLPWASDEAAHEAALTDGG